MLPIMAFKTSLYFGPDVRSSRVSSRYPSTVATRHFSKASCSSLSAISLNATISSCLHSFLWRLLFPTESRPTDSVSLDPNTLITSAVVSIACSEVSEEAQKRTLASLTTPRISFPSARALLQRKSDRPWCIAE